MRKKTAAYVKAHFDEYLEENEGGPVLVTRKGRPVALVLALQDNEELERLALSYSPRFQAILEESETEFRQGKGIPIDQFRRELEAENLSMPAGRKARRKTTKAS